MLHAALCTYKCHAYVFHPTVVPLVSIIKCPLVTMSINITRYDIDLWMFSDETEIHQYKTSFLPGYSEDLLPSVL